MISFDHVSATSGTRHEFEIPVRTISAPNAREHWAVRARRVKFERNAVALCFPRRLRKSKEVEKDDDGGDVLFAVRLTRISSRLITDGDNLQGALKAVRDEVAKQLGIDDGDKRVTWTYGQRQGKQCAVLVTIWTKDEK